jgi:hypothetical protein
MRVRPLPRTAATARNAVGTIAKSKCLSKLSNRGLKNFVAGSSRRPNVSAPVLDHPAIPQPSSRKKTTPQLLHRNRSRAVLQQEASGRKSFETRSGSAQRPPTGAKVELSEEKVTVRSITLSNRWDLIPSRERTPRRRPSRRDTSAPVSLRDDASRNAHNRDEASPGAAERRAAPSETRQPPRPQSVYKGCPYACDERCLASGRRCTELAAGGLCEWSRKRTR